MAHSPHRTQTDQILDHLQDKRTITNLEAQALYKARSLTKRIHELRSRGYRITSVWRIDHTGQRYVRYRLTHKKPKFAQPLSSACARIESFDEVACRKALSGDHHSLWGSFYWDSTVEGHDYWHDRADGKAKLTASDRAFLRQLIDFHTEETK